MKKKITGYQLMARDFASHFRYGEKNELKGEHWWMDFYNQQANIPDGWDVVKEIMEKCEEELFPVDLDDEDTFYDGSNNAYETIKNICKNKLQQAGIEVE